MVDRASRCILSWDVVATRTSEALQVCLEKAPQAKQYYSDAFPVYDTLYYGAPYEMRTDKKETYSVEAVNADLRHYLKRLARKSRCFSRRADALYRNIHFTSLISYILSSSLSSYSLLSQFAEIQGGNSDQFMEWKIDSVLKNYQFACNDL